MRKKLLLCLFMIMPMLPTAWASKFIIKIATNSKKTYVRPLSAFTKIKDTLDLRPGNKFQFIDMIDMNGVKIKAKDFAGKIAVFNFWFTGCPPCVYEIPELNKLTEDYKNNKDVIFIALSDDKAETINSFSKNTPYKYRMVGDGARLFNYYGIKTCPLSLVINDKGIITFNSYGYGIASVPGRIKEALEKLR